MLLCKEVHIISELLYSKKAGCFNFSGGAHMTISMLIALLGGLGLFLYGMKLMGDGLEIAAGSRLKFIWCNSVDKDPTPRCPV